jgi:DNA repair exonuclease SbcCD ATPase subunit
MEDIEMARRRAVEADEFFETANRLTAEDKEVTATTMLDALGGGSLRTIYKHLDEWKRRRPAVVVTGDNDQMPENVRGVFANAWRTARHEAGLEVIAVKEQAAQEVRETLQKFQDALDYSGKLEEENSAADLLIEELRGKLTEAQDEANRAKEEGAGHKARAEELMRQVETQTQELERQRGEAEKERARREEAVREAAELRGSIESLKGQNGELLDRLSGHQAEGHGE